MNRPKLYDGISLICLGIGGILGGLAAYEAIHAIWSKTIVFGVTAIFLWYMSALFARYAIAASGNPK